MFPIVGTSILRVLGEAMIARFARGHSASRKPLQRFLDIARGARWAHFPALKQSFAAADYTPSGMVVFDVGGNKYRILAIVNFDRQTILIERVLTHQEYNRENL
jgi:mRNA interferase HigB